MSPELRDNIAHHRASLHRMLDSHHDLLARLQSEHPTLIEREALAAVLHSFYSGIESILHRGQSLLGPGPFPWDWRAGASAASVANLVLFIILVLGQPTRSSQAALIGAALICVLVVALCCCSSVHIQ